MSSSHCCSAKFVVTACLASRWGCAWWCTASLFATWMKWLPIGRCGCGNGHQWTTKTKWGVNGEAAWSHATWGLRLAVDCNGAFSDWTDCEQFFGALAVWNWWPSRSRAGVFRIRYLLIYIYIYMCVCVCICMYIYMWLYAVYRCDMFHAFHRIYNELMGNVPGQIKTNPLGPCQGTIPKIMYSLVQVITLEPGAAVMLVSVKGTGTHWCWLVRIC